MIRNDRNLQGIKINNKEFKLSQYAGDTQIFLDGSENSLHQLMLILKKFYNLSGLKVSEDKIKALWVHLALFSSRTESDNPDATCELSP